jgi:hypothetical protein
MHQQIIKYTIILTLIFISLTFMCCNNTRTPQELVLFDFESDHELDEVHWKCHTLITVSDQHATHGKGSLKLELYPSPYPGFNPFTKISDWSPYKSLCFDIYNPAEKEERLIVRIDDRGDNTEYEDRYNQGFVLKRGMNHIKINMDSLVTSGTKRKMDTDEICKFLFFIHKPAEKVVLYVDYVRLE